MSYSKTVDVLECQECGWETTVSWVPATRTDPGYPDSDYECGRCGAELDPDSAEKWTLEDLRHAAEGD